VHQIQIWSNVPSSGDETTATTKIATNDYVSSLMVNSNDSSSHATHGEG